VEIITELSPEQILLIISICKYIFDPEKIIPSAIGSAIVETGKNILSRLRKPLPSLDKAELESLITEFKEELKRKDFNLASKIDESRTDIVNYLETTIKGGDEAIKNEIRKNAVLQQEILHALKRLEETLRRKNLERLNKPWTERPSRITNYIAREKDENLIFEKVKRNNIICVQGIPGSGKTSLLTKFFEEVEQSKRAFWCQVREDSTVDSILEVFARVFSSCEVENIKNHLLSPDRIYYNIYEDLRRNLTKYEILFIFDNYHLLKDEQFDMFLKSLLELDLKSTIILATREAVFPPSVKHKIGDVPLQGFTQKEAQKFLQQNGIILEDDCFQTLFKKTSGIPMIILLAVQKLKEISKEQYYEFVSNLPNRDIENYLMETVDEILDADERAILQVLSVLRIPEPLKRVSRLCTFTGAENALDKLEKRFFAMRDVLDRYFSHDLVRDFYLGFMEKGSSDLLCELNWRAYEMYHEDFEEGEVEAGERAIEYAEEVLDFCNIEKVRSLECYVPILRNRVANGFLQIYKPIVAIQTLNSALEDNRRKKDKKSESINLNTLAKAYLAMNDVSRAIHVSEKALEIDEDIGDKRQQAIDMNLLGKAWLDSNNPERAREYLERALEIHGDIGDKRSQAIDMNLLGKAWLDSNNPERAREYLERALEIHGDIGDKRSQAIDMNLLGKISARLNQPNKAIEYYEEALQISKKIEDIKNISYNLHSLGHIYFKRELHVVAEQYFKECTKLPFKINREAWIDAFEKLGDIYKFRGENTKALTYYKKAHKASKGKRRERLEKKIHNLE